MSLDRILQRADIWRGGDHALRDKGAAVQRSVPSGYAELDAQLPGGGWPMGALAELLLEQQGIGEVQLLLPALAQLSRGERWLMWISPPYLPYAPALATAGVELTHMLITRPRTQRDALWAMEQALRSGACAAVLAWLEEPDPQAVRRLQLAAETGGSLGVLFRPLQAAAQASPAALRLQLSAAADGLEVQIIKRRGGWSRQPVRVRRGHAVA